MARQNKAKEKNQPQAAPPETPKSDNKRFTSDMRYIVVRNMRNAWIDEQYEDTLDVTQKAIFH